MSPLASQARPPPLPFPFIVMLLSRLNPLVVNFDVSAQVDETAYYASEQSMRSSEILDELERMLTSEHWALKEKFCHCSNNRSDLTEQIQSLSEIPPDGMTPNVKLQVRQTPSSLNGDRLGHYPGQLPNPVLSRRRKHGGSLSRRGRAARKEGRCQSSGSSARRKSGPPLAV